MAFKTKKKFQVEIYNAMQSVYPDVYKTKKFKTLREAISFGNNESGNFTMYRIRENGKVIFEDK